MTTPTLGTILYSYFEDHLKCQKGLSVASIKSYRDSIRLFLQFVARDTRRKITSLALSALTAERARQFLRSLETERANHTRTRNLRLSALHTFFEYLGYQVPEMLAEAERVAAIPKKRVPPPETFFLERDEMETLFANLPKEGRFALRDRALLLFLYNTGARAQEVADLRANNLEMTSHPRVHLHGKGDKWRVCPLWTETSSLLKQLLGEQPTGRESDRPVFSSLHGQPLTRHGIYKIVRRHTNGLATQGANLTARRVSPHVFRHSTAVALLESGVELNVIRGWLGHVGLDTTHRYAEINIRMKEKALAACEPPVSASAGSPRKAIWRDDPSLLKWLQSL